ncbi:unnamed protein product [Closterium sp. NIES-64]|nr:unnamed protein product [Closterium sp. NIES-64]
MRDHRRRKTAANNWHTPMRSRAVLASELPRGEEDRWVLCGAGQRAPQGGGGPVGPVRCWPASSPGGRRTGGSCAVLASELPRGEKDRWVLCGAGQRAPQGGGGPVGPVRCWPASSPGGRRTCGSYAVLASEIPSGEEDRWVLCGAGQRAPQGGGGPVGPVRCWPASSPGGRRTGGSCAVLASELPRGEEDRWVLCGAGQRAPQGGGGPTGGGGPVGPVRCWPARSPVGRRTGGSCAVLASELPRGEEDRWVLCGAGQRASQGGGGPVGPVCCWPASSPGGRRTGGPCAVLASELPRGEEDRL